MKKIVIPSGILAARVVNLSKIVTKTTLPVLDSMLFTVKDGVCQIVAADMESQVSTNIVLEEADDIRFGLDAKMLLNSLKEIPEQPLVFNLKESTNECTINYNNGKFCIPMTDITEYPVAVAVNEDEENSINADTFRTLINKCSAYVASDELRPVMNGINFDFKDTLVCAASDGHSLVRITCKGNQTSKQGSFILSFRSAKLCESYVGKQSGDVTISYNNTHAKFVFEDYTFTTRLIEGRYPNYNSVIPTDYTESVLVDRKSLLSTIKRVAVFASAASGLLKLKLDGMQLELQGKDIDFSTSSVETMMVTKNGRDIQAGLKASYLTKICSTVESENINIFYKDASRAFIFRPEVEHENYDILLLQMPMMLND